MTVRRIGIDQLELRLPAGSLQGADRTAPALNSLGRAVAACLADRFGAAPLADSLFQAAPPRRIEVSVPAFPGPANPGKIAEAVERGMRKATRTTPRRGR
jgi:hypothetical protein